MVHMDYLECPFGILLASLIWATLGYLGPSLPLIGPSLRCIRLEAAASDIRVATARVMLFLVEVKDTVDQTCTLGTPDRSCIPVAAWQECHTLFSHWADQYHVARLDQFIDNYSVVEFVEYAGESTIHESA